MRVLSDAPFAVGWLSRGAVAAGLLFGLIGGMGCRSEHTAAEQVVLKLQMVRPAADGLAANTVAPGVAAVTTDVAAVTTDVAAADSLEELAEYCRQVELQARETDASLPKRLDKDTSATRVAAYGCDVVLEYTMLDLRVGDVALNGVRALRADVLDKLCSDRGARGVLNHGGSFTNVYRDDQSALIDQFTIAEADCWDRRRSADGAPARVDL